MNLIFILIVIVTGIILGTVWNIKIAKAKRLSEEKRQKVDFDAAKVKKRLAEEDMLEQKEMGKHRAEVAETERKAGEDRKLREDELRRKIEERKKHESELK